MCSSVSSHSYQVSQTLFHWFRIEMGIHIDSKTSHKLPFSLSRMESINIVVPAGADYSRLVFSATDGGDLFTLDSILSMCHIEAQLMAGEQFHSICETISNDRCCHSWSLGNYIALLHNRTSCFGVTVSVQRSVRTTDSVAEPWSVICWKSLLILQLVCRIERCWFNNC
jgi:hypothetical protein